MEAPSSPREASPAVAVLAVPIPTQPLGRKRKHAAISGGPAASPAPSDGTGTPNPANDNVVIHTKQFDLASRPRLTVSRHPSFIPVAPGSPYHSTEPLCFNRLNFRYTPAGISNPTSAHPFRTIESAPQALRVSWEDRSPFIKVTPDGLGLRGEKGFRSARCNAPVREGKWYMEVKITLGGGDKPEGAKRKEGSHVRVGWARREAPLGGPAGLDGYSYAVRDKTGEKVHLSRPRPYGQPFKSGDVVGMYISLPSPRRQPNKKDPHDPAHIQRERIAIEFKGQEYFESLEYSQSKEMLALMEANNRSKDSSSTPAPPPTKKSATVKNLPSTSRGKASLPEPAPMRPLPTLGPESCVAFFVNGQPQGIAFQDLYDYLPLRKGPDKTQEKKRAHKDGIREHKENPFDDGSLGYYPVISLFNEAEVRINPGPDFDYPPPADIDAVLVSPNDDVKPSLDSTPKWRPMCDRYPEYMAEQFALDDADEAEDAKQVQARQAVESKKVTDQEKLELHRAKRRAQAARRREKRLKEKEHGEPEVPAADDPDFVPIPQLDQQSRDPSMEVDSALIEDRESRYSSPGIQSLEPLVAENPHAGPAIGLGFSPSLVVGSVGDVQSYWLGTGNDTSEYNTEYEDGAAEVDSQGPDVRFEDELMN